MVVVLRSRGGATTGLLSSNSFLGCWHIPVARQALKTSEARIYVACCVAKRLLPMLTFCGGALVPRKVCIILTALLLRCSRSLQVSFAWNACACIIFAKWLVLTLVQEWTKGWHCLTAKLGMKRQGILEITGSSKVHCLSVLDPRALEGSRLSWTDWAGLPAPIWRLVTTGL